MKINFIELKSQYQKYTEKLNYVISPFIEQHNSSVCSQYCILVDNREKIIAKYISESISTTVYYPRSLPLQKVFQYLNYHKGYFAVSEEISSKILA